MGNMQAWVSPILFLKSLLCLFFSKFCNSRLHKCNYGYVESCLYRRYTYVTSFYLRHFYFFIMCIARQAESIGAPPKQYKLRTLYRIRNKCFFLDSFQNGGNFISASISMSSSFDYPRVTRNRIGVVGYHRNESVWFHAFLSLNCTRL